MLLGGEEGGSRIPVLYQLALMSIFIDELHWASPAEYRRGDKQEKKSHYAEVFL